MSAPDAEALAAAEKEATRQAPLDKQLQQNFLFSAYFNREDGLYADHQRKLSRRKWIEKYFYIVDKNERLVPLKLNRAQRKLEAWILRMERAGVPIRIVICKARQQGFSTYIQAIMFEAILRGKNKRGLIVADNKERSEMLLKIANTARAHMPRYPVEGDEEPVYWDFKMNSKAKYALGWARPINGQIGITSSEVERPGMGGTRGFVHLSETAHFIEPERKYPSILASLPSVPGTYGFDESTANGDSGLFRDNWWAGWEERNVPIRERKFQWSSLFFAWWESEEYFYSRTYGGGKEPSAEMTAEIARTLDDEEKWLLEQKYFERGVGWKNVGYDQLAWRRTKLRDAEIHNDINLFNQEYPSRPSLAFISSGNKVFPPDILDRYSRKATDPIWTGTLEEPAKETGEAVTAGFTEDAWGRVPIPGTDPTVSS